MSQWFAQTLHYDWTLTAPPIVSREAGLSADNVEAEQAFAVKWQHLASHNGL
jgi:hypothetical protein